MVPRLRDAYNASYSAERYARYTSDLRARTGSEIAFPLAETPVFLDPALAQACSDAAEAIVAQLADAERLSRVRELLDRVGVALPPLPPRETLPQFAAVDFALARASDGTLVPRLVELQGFPSLFGFELCQHDAWVAAVDDVFPSSRWSSFFGPQDRNACASAVRAAIVGTCDPAEVVLLDVEPRRQKTYCDFAATEKMFGVVACDPRELEVAGGKVYRRDARGTRLPVARIFNRVVGEDSGLVPESLLDPDVDVRWAPHPAWFYLWSKAALPFLSHPCAPKTVLLSQDMPESLDGYVLKPLFSYAGSGVNVAPSRADAEAIPAHERAGWCLQERIDYAEALRAADGGSVKVELRVMLVRADDGSRLVPALNLCRLSRGAMHGVDHNKGMTWVGSSIALWEAG